ncbi:MAG: sel1 repeat family protein [Alistipes sp.]|nr:sel1 repeat family protein [Alistipes sp.]
MGIFYSNELEKGIKLLYHQNDKSKYPEAVSLIEKAVANDEPDAYYVLARCYAWGDSGLPDSKENDNKAIELSKRGAELGSSLAILGADRFSRLKAVEPFMKVTHEQAFEEAVKMAESGNALAMYAVGLVYFWGDITALPKYALSSRKDNSVAGVKWFDKAADKGFIPAFKNAYISRRDGTNEVPVDISAAIRLVEIVQGHCEIPPSFYVNIGNDYDKLGDKDKMIEWYRRGVEAGDAMALYNLAYSYENGDGVPKDYAAAVEYYRKSKDAGYGGADKALSKFKKTLFGKIKKR